MISAVISLLAGHLAAGILWVTAAISLSHRLPESFVRFCTGASAAAAFVAGALASGDARWIWLALGATSIGWYAWLHTRAPAKLVALLVLLVATLAFPAPAFVDAITAAWWLSAAGSASSALLLGAVSVTMVLGHWYLVDTSLSIGPLKSGAFWFWVAVVGRWLAVGAALLFGGFELLRISRAADIIFSTTGLFFMFRSLVGLGAPLVLAGLIWQTVKMRSTQSATGLLYVALILVFFGELISHFLRYTTRFPL